MPQAAMRPMTHYRSGYASCVMTCWSQPRRSVCLPRRPAWRSARLLLLIHSCRANCGLLPRRLVRSRQSVRKYLTHVILLLLLASRPQHAHFTTGGWTQRRTTALRIVIADAHRAFADALESLLCRSDHQVVGYAVALDAAAEAVARKQADACVFDADLACEPGAIEKAMALASGTAFVALADSQESAGLDIALAAGAHGAALKTDDFVEFMRVLSGACARATRRAAGGAVLSLSAQAARRSYRSGSSYPWWAESLTPREREVLARLVRGESTTSMARSMGVRLSTTRTHVESILIKLGVHSRLEAIAYAVKEGIIAVPRGSAGWAEGEPSARSG